MESVASVLDDASASAVWDILKLEHLGSALDVLDAVGELLVDLGVERLQLPSLCSLLFEALGARSAEVLCATRVAYADSGLDAFEWKREYKSNSERFVDDYNHHIRSHDITLAIQQRAFQAEGFASTIWDSAIVLSRMFELQGLHTTASHASTCIELGAGCGLVGLTLSVLGYNVVMTDLPGNLRLLRANVRANTDASSHRAPRVRPLTWGEPLTPELALPAYDMVVGTDLFYAREAMPQLVESLLMLTGPQTVMLLAAGRNRHAGKLLHRQACSSCFSTTASLLIPRPSQTLCNLLRPHRRRILRSRSKALAD